MKSHWLVLAVAVAVAGATMHAQQGDPLLPPTVPQWFDRGEVPDWENDPKFEKDVFTFVRVYFDSYAGGPA